MSKNTENVYEAFKRELEADSFSQELSCNVASGLVLDKVYLSDCLHLLKLVVRFLNEHCIDSSEQRKSVLKPTKPTLFIEAYYPNADLVQVSIKNDGSGFPRTESDSNESRVHRWRSATLAKMHAELSKYPKLKEAKTLIEHLGGAFEFQIQDHNVYGKADFVVHLFLPSSMFLREKHFEPSNG